MPVNVIGTLKPKNNGKFPVAEAVDIKVTEDLRLDEALENKADLTTLNFALAGKADTADLTALEAEVDTKADSSDLTTATTSLQAQIDNIVSGSTADSEVINARVDVNGTSYSTLKARIDNAEYNTTEVKSELDSLISGMKDNGIPTKVHISESYFGTPYVTGYYYSSRYETQVGINLANMNKVAVPGANVYLIPIDKLSSVKFRVFLTTSGGGSYFLDENQVCIAEMINTTETTGTIHEYSVPENAKYLLYSISKGLYDTALDIFVEEYSVDEITNEFNDINERLDKNGLSTYDKITSFGTPYKTGALEFATNQVGKNIDEIPVKTNVTSEIYQIDIANSKNIKFPVLNSVSNLGSCFTDANGICVAQMVNSTVPTGTYLTYSVPQNAKYLFYSVTQGLINSGAEIYVECEKNATLQDKVDEALYYATLENISEIKLTSGYIYTNVDIGDTVDLTAISSNITKSAVIDCTGYDNVSISGHGGENGRLWAFVDEDDRLISKSDESITVSNLVLQVPANAKSLIINSIDEQKSYLGLPKTTLYNLIQEKENAEYVDISGNENRNLCLGGIKTDIVSNKTPYHSGFLFHKLRNDDKSLWYGNRFNRLEKIGTVDFYPSQCRLAVSPKDGRVIATVRDTRRGIYVWDGETTTLVNGFTVEPMAWLYNAGVDFIVDNNDDEYCIFAEYKSSSDEDGFNVWRGKYPYTSKSDWEVVLHQNYGWTGEGNITHFHQIKRDPWTDILYCTSGDSEQSSAVCRWWYSTDYGATWTLLTDGVTSGYEEHITRIINFIFTKDYIYFATDHGTNHCLNRVARDNNGIIDVSSRVKLCDLPEGHATNSLCYSHAPKGIFMYDRIDTGYTEHYGEDLPLQFYDLRTNTLKTITTLNLITNEWGGCRGKCYINYTNGNQPYPAMGYGTEAYCQFDLANSNSLNDIATVEFDFDGTVHTVEH